MEIYEKGKKTSLRLTVHSKVNQSEELKLRQAAKHIVAVINSDEFKDFVLNYSYEYTVCRGALWWKKCHIVKVDNFNWNDGLSREEIYNKIMTGQEDLRPEADQEIDIDLEIDRRFSRNVIGYTYPNSIKQWIYANFFSKYTYKEVASNASHEYFHKLGFDHAFKYHYTRQFTVPYAIGYYIRDAKGYFEQ